MLRTGLAAMATATIAALVAVAVWQPWQADERARPTGSATDGTEGAGGSVHSERLVLDAAGLTLASSSLPVGSGSTRPAEPRGFVFATGASSLAGGPMLAFQVSGDDGSAADVRPAGAVEIGGIAAGVNHAGQSVEVWWAGRPGLRYAALGEGMAEAQVIAFARATTFEDGVTTVTDSAVLDGLQPAGDITTLLGLVAMTRPFGAPADVGTVIGVQYASAAEGTITLSSMPAAAGDFALVAGMLLDGEHAVAVGGEHAVVGDLAPDLRQREGQRMLVWPHDGRLIALVATVDDARLLELAATVRAATADEWAAVEAVRYNGEAFGTHDVGSAPADSVGNPAEP